LIILYLSHVASFNYSNLELNFDTASPFQSGIQELLLRQTARTEKKLEHIRATGWKPNLRPQRLDIKDVRPKRLRLPDHCDKLV